MATTVDSSPPPTMGMVGSSRQRSLASTSGRMSASILGSGGFGTGSLRARPTTQEIIADTFGRRLHGLDLLSVKKLNALSASAARLEAHMASRAAAITRTVGAGTAAADGAGSSGGASGGGGLSVSPALSRELPSAGSFLASTFPPQDGGRQGAAAPDPSLLPSAATSPAPSLPQSPATTVRPPAGQAAMAGVAVVGVGLGAGLSAPPSSSPLARSPLPSSSWQAGRYDGMSSIADRGSNVVRLLALQDHVLAGAVRAQAAMQLGSSANRANTPGTGGGAGGAGGSEAGGRGGGGGSRFALLGSAGGGEGSVAGGVSVEEARRLDGLGIKHGSKVAEATVQLFRLTPRKMSSADAEEGGEPATPPNTARGVGEEEEPSPALEGLQSAVRKQMVKNRDFAAMSHFVQALQDADELSLITRARNFARQHSKRLSRNLDRTISASSSAAPAAAAGGGGRDGGGPPSPLSPRSPLSPPRWLPSPPTPRSAAAAAAAPRLAASGSLGQRAVSAGGVSIGRSALGSPRGRLAIPEESELDLSRHSTGQARSRDLLDGLMSAVSGGLNVGVLGSIKDTQLRSGRLSASTSFGYGLGSAAAAADAVAAGAAAAAGLQEDEQEPGEAPFSGVYGSPERLARRMRRRGEMAAVANPAGYREEAAAAEVALYREVADRGRSALKRTVECPPDALAAAELQRQVTMLHFCRPYFVAPGEPPPEVAVPLRPAAASPSRHLARQPTLMVLSAPHESCFLPRAADSDSEDIVDSNTVRERQVRRDWNRVVRKDAFRALFAHDDPGVAGGSAGLGHALDACLAVLLRHKDGLRAAFIYYSMTNPSVSDVCFTMGLAEWRAFALDTGLAAVASDSGGAVSVGGGGGSASGGGGGTAAATTSTSASGGAPAAGGSRPRVPSLALGRPRTSVPGTSAAAGGGGGAAATSTSTSAPGGAGPVASGAAARASPRALERLSIGGGTVPGTASGSAAAAAAAAGGTAASAYVAVDAVFAVVNSEADKRSVERPAGAERCLLRFEWYEALIRLAVARHVKGGEKCGSIAAALEHMWTRDVLPALPPAALHEPNGWRVSRLFADPRVNDLLAAHMEVITAIYDLFRAANPHKLLHLADWVGLLSTCGILGEATGLTPRAAKLAFARSLPVVVDELGRWARAVAADKCDLLEALARLAEELAPPPYEEVAAAFRDVLGLGGRGLQAAMAHPWLFYYSLIPESHLQARRRAAAEAAAAAQAAAAAAQAAAEASRITAASTAATPATPSAASGPFSRSPVLAAVVAAADLDALARRTAAAAVAAAGRMSPASSPFASTLAAATAAGSRPLSPHWAPPPTPPPTLSVQLEALLDLLLGRLREHWECDTNDELAVRLQATARSLTSGM